jgi:hypothetical protein
MEITNEPLDEILAENKQRTAELIAAWQQGLAPGGLIRSGRERSRDGGR